MAKTKRRKRYPKENIVKILLLIIVVWLLAMLSMNQIVSSLVKTEEVQTTVLEHTDSGYGLISGNEYTISAPADVLQNAQWRKECGYGRVMRCLT